MADSASEPRTTDSFLAAPARPGWPLRTERLTLRPWAEGDFEAFFEMQRDEEVARWQYNDPRDEAESRRVFDYKKMSYELLVRGDD
jgi:RimJ/RimL family protein N-acetyltransferase